MTLVTIYVGRFEKGRKGGTDRGIKAHTMYIHVHVHVYVCYVLSQDWLEGGIYKYRCTYIG